MTSAVPQAKHQACYHPGHADQESRASVAFIFITTGELTIVFGVFIHVITGLFSFLADRRIAAFVRYVFMVPLFSPRPHAAIHSFHAVL